MTSCKASRPESARLVVLPFHLNSDRQRLYPSSYGTGANDLQAKFADDGASIIVSFSPDGSASSGLLDPGDPGSGSGPGSCDALLDASTVAVIGGGALCKSRLTRKVHVAFCETKRTVHESNSRLGGWATDNSKPPGCLRFASPSKRRRVVGSSLTGEWTSQRELTVWVGIDPAVVADSESMTCSGEKSCITLLEGGIRTEAFAVLSSSGWTPILAPDQAPGVSAVLVAPQVTRRPCALVPSLFPCCRAAAHVEVVLVARHDEPTIEELECTVCTGVVKGRCPADVYMWTMFDVRG